MTDTPWLGDACSLVDAFRSGERTPTEELELVLGAIDRSALNSVSFVDAERARRGAAAADPNLPFGGVPIGVKELDYVAGWPATEASLVFKDRTIPANICGNPAISIPVAPVDGLPVGMQVMGKHHEDALLLDLALVVERTCPWPLVATGAPV